MSHSPEAKLHELRSKTTRQLVSLINHQLDRGLAFARMVGAEGADWATREQFTVDAEQALTHATSWMTLLDGASPLDQRRLQFKVNQLHDVIEHMRASEVRVQAAC